MDIKYVKDTLKEYPKRIEKEKNSFKILQKGFDKLQDSHEKQIK